MTGLLAAVVVVAVGIAACSSMDKTVQMADAAERAMTIVTAVLEGRMNEARQSFNAQVLEAFTDEVRGSALATVADLVGPASTTAVSPSRWQGSGKLALPGQAR